MRVFLARQACGDEVVGVAQVHFGEVGEIEVGGGAEGCGVEAGDVEVAVFDVQGWVAVGVAVVEVAMVGKNGFPDGFGPGGEALEVVVAVALDVLDAEGGHDGEVLQEGDGADVGEVFAREVDGAFPGSSRLGEGGRVCDALDDALAVLVAGAVVAEGEGVGQ